MKECSLISLNRTQLTIRLSKTGKIEMKIRNQRLSIITATLLCLAVVPQSANAIWYIDRLSIDEGLTTVDRMLGEDLLQVRSDVYYKVDVAQIESTPQAAGTISAPVEVAKYAVVLDGVIDKIINWDGFSGNEDLSENAVIIKLPKGDGVTYIDEKGVLRLSAIYQGSIVSAQVSPTELVTPKVGLVEKAPLTEPAPPVGTPVPFENAPQVTSQKVAADNSVSMTIQVPTVNVPANSTVHVQVVTDGRSTTSIGIDPNTPSTTVTVNNLPQNENVTVKTVITDTITPEPARNPAVDKATVAAPAVTSSTTDATGHRVVDIKTPVIPDYDPTKSVASLLVVGPGGSTTSIGLFGSGETLSVGSLSPDANYTVKIVIRDLGSGKETIISGEQISKGVNP
jgi:hypothetical protein